MSLNDDPCMIRPTIIDLNSVELKYYPFLVSLDICSGSCNSCNDLSIRICVPSKTKYLNVKAFNMITNRNDAKTLIKHFPCDCKCKFSSRNCNSKRKWNNEKC